MKPQNATSGPPDLRLRPDMIRTRDFDEAHSLISSVYVPHELKSRDGQPLDFKFHFLQSHQLTIGHLNYGADAELLVPAMRRHYHLNLTLHGATLVTQSGQRATTAALRRGVVFRPFEDFTVRWSPDALQYAVLVPSAAIESHLGGLLNHPIEGPIDFQLAFDMTTAGGQGLLSAISFLRSELARPGGLAESPLARGQLESFAMTQMLLAVPHRYSDELRAPTKPANRNRIKSVIDLIDSQPESDLSIGRLTEVAGVSARALQVGFRQAVGLTPLAYVRKVRLDRVRDELIVLAGQRSVTDVAVQWGFVHLGRFSAYYKQQFGETPSDTVRNALRNS
ncbi:MAG: AraC family transcriptional regulator [Rhodococcus sp. (in: high G+C Gram-positive bacteria)]